MLFLLLSTHWHPKSKALQREVIVSMPATAQKIYRYLRRLIQTMLSNLLTLLQMHINFARILPLADFAHPPNRAVRHILQPLSVTLCMHPAPSFLVVNWYTEVFKGGRIKRPRSRITRLVETISCPFDLEATGEESTSLVQGTANTFIRTNAQERSDMSTDSEHVEPNVTIGYGPLNVDERQDSADNRVLPNNHVDVLQYGFGCGGGRNPWRRGDERNNSMSNGLPSGGETKFSFPIQGDAASTSNQETNCPSHTDTDGDTGTTKQSDCLGPKPAFCGRHHETSGEPSHTMILEEVDSGASSAPTCSPATTLEMVDFGIGSALSTTLVQSDAGSSHSLDCRSSLGSGIIRQIRPHAFSFASGTISEIRKRSSVFVACAFTSPTREARRPPQLPKPRTRIQPHFPHRSAVASTVKQSDKHPLRVRSCLITIIHPCTDVAPLGVHAGRNSGPICKKEKRGLHPAMSMRPSARCAGQWPSVPAEGLWICKGPVSSWSVRLFAHIEAHARVRPERLEQVVIGRSHRCRHLRVPPQLLYREDVMYPGVTERKKALITRLELLLTLYCTMLSVCGGLLIIHHVLVVLAHRHGGGSAADNRVLKEEVFAEEYLEEVDLRLQVRMGLQADHLISHILVAVPPTVNCTLYETTLLSTTGCLCTYLSGSKP
ncbi:hypothetical protein KC319_g64 [Hortaea werneckii]|nr:hypothetical protein KC319_g64 [Hortaea werneckii]